MLRANQIARIASDFKVDVIKAEIRAVDSQSDLFDNFVIVMIAPQTGSDGVILPGISRVSETEESWFLTKPVLAELL